MKQTELIFLLSRKVPALLGCQKKDDTNALERINKLLPIRRNKKALSLEPE